MQVLDGVNKRVEGGFGLKVAWVEAHPTKRSGRHTRGDRWPQLMIWPTSWQKGAEMDGGHFAELVAGDALEMRKNIDAAIRYAAVLIAKWRTWWILRKLQLK